MSSTSDNDDLERVVLEFKKTDYLKYIGFALSLISLIVAIIGMTITFLIYFKLIPANFELSLPAN